MPPKRWGSQRSTHTGGTGGAPHRMMRNGDDDDDEVIDLTTPPRRRPPPELPRTRDRQPAPPAPQVSLDADIAEAISYGADPGFAEVLREMEPADRREMLNDLRANANRAGGQHFQRVDADAAPTGDDQRMAALLLQQEIEEREEEERRADLARLQELQQQQQRLERQARARAQELERMENARVPQPRRRSASGGRRRAEFRPRGPGAFVMEDDGGDMPFIPMFHHHHHHHHRQPDADQMAMRDFFAQLANMGGMHPMMMHHHHHHRGGGGVPDADTIRRFREQQAAYGNVDVDNMSYEELLELQDKAGMVNAGYKDSEIKSVIEPEPSPPMGEDDSCVICMTAFKDSRDNDCAKMKSCGHVFHQHCIDKWLHERKRCPICNQQ